MIWWLACSAPVKEPSVADTHPRRVDTDAQDTVATEDSDPPFDTFDTGDSGDSGSDWTPCEGATFTPTGGDPEDLSQAFTDGDYVVIDEDGTLAFCGGTWFVKLTVEASVAVVGLGLTPEHTVLSGGEQASVITVSGPYALSVENVTLHRGAALGSRNNDRSGGGLRCDADADISLRDVVMSDNRAYDGAAFYAGAGCHVDAESVTLRDNVSEDDAGAARFDNASGDLRDLYVENNSARDAGGLLLHESDVVIDGGVFSGNVTTDSQGGGLLHYFGTLAISRTVFEANDANGQGGGLSLFGDTVLTEVAFVDNIATYGGGVYHYGSYGTLTCAGCTFDGNTPDPVQSDVTGSFEPEDAGDFVCDEAGCR